jgi:glycosyltransferase involved in cell wall biosynthesis
LAAAGQHILRITPARILEVRDLSVSVALATYNGARYLPDQLADLSAQSFTPAEVVVCDDASSDDTLSIVDQFAASAPFPVRVHRNPARLGFRENFVRCAAKCSSALIAFCDQDDRWPSHKLRAAVDRFQDPSVLLLFHNARVVAADGRPIATLYPRSMPPKRWEPLTSPPWSFSPGFTQVFRRGLLEFDDLWDLSVDENADGERLAHDRWYFFLSSVLGSVQYVADCLADYRQHGQNAYGWRRFAPSLQALVLDRLDDAGRAIARRGRAAESRAIVLDRIADRVDEPSRGRAVLAAKAFRKLGERCSIRAEIYESATLVDRAKSLLNLLRAGAYGSDPWKFGPYGLAMDGLTGVTGLHSKSGRRIAARTDAGNMK